MGLLIKGNKVTKPLNWSAIDGQLRRSLQAQEVLRIDQTTDQINVEAGEWYNQSTSGSGDPTATIVVSGLNTVLEDVMIGISSFANWSYTLSSNGSVIQSGTGSGYMADTSISTSFKNKIFKPTDSFTLTVTRTSGVGAQGGNIRIKGWNI